MYILTGDRDSLQLISDKTRVILATNAEPILFDSAAFEEKYGVRPDQYVDVKSLMGDASDNIPGVKGIGEKTAFKLISEYGSLDELYTDTESKKIAPAAKAKIIDGKESAYMSKFLATIKRDVDMGCDFESFRYSGMDKAKLFELFTRLEFTKFIKKFGAESAEAETEAESAEENFIIVQKDVSSLEKGVKYAVTLDIGAEKIYFCRESEVFADTLENSLSYLSDSSYEFIVHDAKTAYHALSRYGCDFAACRDDVMLMAYVAAVSENDFSLEKLCSRLYGKTVSVNEEKAFYI